MLVCIACDLLFSAACFVFGLDGSFAFHVCLFYVYFMLLFVGLFGTLVSFFKLLFSFRVYLICFPRLVVICCLGVCLRCCILS